MAKVMWKPGTMINPLPALLVTCGSSPKDWNVLTVAWTGTICTDPAMCYISVRKERHSYGLIAENMEFTINLTTEDMARATDWCGVKSGRDVNKFEATGLTPIPGELVSSPTIEQSPLSIECAVTEIMHLGSHDMFMAKVLGVRADDRYIDHSTGRFDLDKARMIAYSHGHYYALGQHLGHFGFSVRKK
ncbi:MAG: flavin reductase family protein [Muribaculaceae bacterium]|nr:flavin reductase family protein [Muribaculaceae bacterium]